MARVSLFYRTHHGPVESLFRTPKSSLPQAELFVVLEAGAEEHDSFDRDLLEGKAEST